MNNLKIYPEFTANQTLSHENLNELFQYLDAEQRQTRQQLIGTGILCGFHLHPMGPGTYLSPGIAITTEGYVLAMKKQFNFNYYRKFEDKGSSYIPLKTKVVEVLDEVPEDEKESNLIKFSELPPQIREGVVVVYLEDQLKDIESCEGESCDNKGKEHRLSLKVLIISKSQAAMFVDDEAKYYADIKENIDRHPAYNIGRLKISRPLITEHIVRMSDLKALFSNCVGKAKNDLIKYLTNLKEVFPNEYSKLQVFKNELPLVLKELDSSYSNFQQIYDWFENLFRALNEWVDYVQSSHLSCINRTRKFQRHVFTGSMTRQQYAPQLYRHYFEAVQKDSMSLDKFEVLNILSERVNCSFNKVTVNKLRQIAVLPEKRSSGKLADRAIPYFLNYNSLKRNWVPGSDLVQRLDFDNFGVNREKLSCSFEDKDFFRIDGHVGLNRKDALEELHRIRANYNLEFDIKALYVDRPDSTEYHNCCSYETLTLMYQIASQGLKTQILEPFSFISRLNKYVNEDNYSITPIMQNYLRSGYKVKDFRHLDIFTDLRKDKGESTDTEGLRKFMEEKPVEEEVNKDLEIKKEALESGEIKPAESPEEITALKEAAAKEAAAKEAAAKEAAAKEELQSKEALESKKRESIGYDFPEDEMKIEVIKSAYDASYQPIGVNIPEGSSINKEMQANIEKIINSQEIKNNPQIKEKLQELINVARTAGNTGKTTALDYKVVHDGIYNLLVNEKTKHISFVEANPHLAKYSSEMTLEKTLPSLMIDIYDLYKHIPSKIESLKFESLQDLYLTISRKINEIYKSLEIVHESHKCHYGIKLIFYILSKINFTSLLSQIKLIEQLYTDKQKKLEEKNILANVVKMNPGLEHRAGVPVGGTFFLLTQKGAPATKESSGDEFLETIIKMLRSSKKENAIRALKEIEGRKLNDKEEIISILDKYGLYGVIGEEVARRSKRELFEFRDDNMGDDLVIGDFCLSSTIECCDLRYIVHTDIRLDAAKKIFCDDDKRINLDVHPRGGTISGNGTTQDGHNYMFNPSHPDVEIGENILTYSIADEKVDLILEVLEHPTAEIKVLSKKIDDGTAIIEVEANSTGGTLYEWSYDDEKPERGNKKHTFNIPADSPEIEVTLKLKVSNKACSATDTERVRLTDVQLILPAKVLCSTDKVITLSGKPAGGKFSGTGVKADKFTPSAIKFAAKESVKKIDITYTLGDDSETKNIAVIKHPKAVIKVIEERLGSNYAVLRLQNGTEPLDGYEYIWDINGSKIPGKEEIHNEFKYIDGKVVVQLTAGHPKLKSCSDTAELTFEQPVIDEPPVEDEKPNTDKTFEAIKELNNRNNEFFSHFKDELNTMEYNPDILTGSELKLVQSLLNFIDQISQDELIERVQKLVNLEMEELVPKIQKAAESGVAGPEITMYAIRLVSVLNITSISTAKISIGNPLKSIAASINKIKSANPGIRYSLQKLVPADLWMNKDNLLQAEKFWSTVKP